MPIDNNDIKLLQQAFKCIESGDRINALVLIDLFGAASIRNYDSLSPTEIMDVVASIAKFYEYMGEWEMAALKYSDVCSYAHKNEPGTIETAIDFFNLAKMLDKIGDYSYAIIALERSIAHNIKAGHYEKNKSLYIDYLDKLKKQIE
jgi:tetratricopeptide (TPR) repeat protein